MKKIAAIAGLLCGMSIAFSASADELDGTATNESGLSSMHGVNGGLEEYSEENVEIPPSIKANQTVQAIRLSPSEIRKLYRQKSYREAISMDGGLYLRIGHFSVYLIHKE